MLIIKIKVQITSTLCLNHDSGDLFDYYDRMNLKNHANHKNQSSDNELTGRLFSYFRKQPTSET